MSAPPQEAASPPHKHIKLHFLDCKLTSSRLNRFYLPEKSVLANGYLLTDNGSAREG
ncbi:MAG: hypothetical protein FWH20_02920 [Oscillospiraceae bacterium]|nr:hypothetical protein [Oscillospiraceae bacterium]